MIFRTKVWKLLFFEWILLLEIQTNCKNWVWKENSLEASMCSHLGQGHILHFENDVNKIEALRPNNIARIQLPFKYFKGFNNDFTTKGQTIYFQCET